MLKSHENGLIAPRCNVELHTTPTVPSNYVAELAWQVGSEGTGQIIKPITDRFEPQPPPRPRPNEKFRQPPRTVSERASLYWLKFADRAQAVDWRVIPPDFSDEWKKVDEPTRLETGTYFVVAIRERSAPCAKDIDMKYGYQEDA